MRPQPVVEPLVSSPPMLAPLPTVTWPAGNEDGVAATMAPAVTLVLPAKLLAPVRKSVPAPFFVRAEAVPA